MGALFVLLLMAGVPFWETKPPDQWSDDELQEFFRASPWVKMLDLQTAVGGVQGIPVYLSTARPMRDAEVELKLRLAKKRPPEFEDDDEYEEFLRENPGNYIVVAVKLPDPRVLRDAKEYKRMEEECRLRIGGETYQLAGHFPPTPPDPFLRLVFPRAVKPDTRSLRFELYLPSVPAPYRNADFEIRDLLYKGKPEM
jgi:hypothetical protein